MSVLERLWWNPAPGPGARALLAPLAVPEALFRAAVALRQVAYDRGLAHPASAGAPVVSIGNLAVGGAGKTPAAIAVAGRLQARGRTVAILSRGYGASRADARVVSDGRAILLGAAEGGDEPALLARRLPGARVLCGPRRSELARIAVASLAADALVLDDGFQHRALGRDLDVVVIDASSPFGNGRLLPRGPNREPPGALRRAGLVWLSRADRGDAAALERLRALAREATGRAPVESRHAPTALLDGRLERPLELAALRGRRVLALSGLARPASFHATLAALGAEIAAVRAYPDHHRFEPGEVEAALREARSAGCALVVTTEKDAVRLPPAAAADPLVAAVRIEAEILRGEDGLEAALDAALAAGDARRGERARAAAPAAASTGGTP
jgi:tetraacyldisaccharide 4'-kinase